jgi:hypothetical protein
MNSGVTYLTDLPELDALEPHQPHIQPGYDKFIRDAHGRPGGRDPYRQLSGMTETGSSMTRPPMVPFNAGPAQAPQVPQVPQVAQPMLMDGGDAAITCRQVFAHIANCPICSSYYKRDNTMLYVIMVGMMIAITFLLKRLYDIQLKQRGRSD